MISIPGNLRDIQITELSVDPLSTITIREGMRVELNSESMQGSVRSAPFQLRITTPTRAYVPIGLMVALHLDKH
jgi:hypothetical protein